jgi:Predicted integral membrane protein
VLLKLLAPRPAAASLLPQALPIWLGVGLLAALVRIPLQLGLTRWYRGLAQEQSPHIRDAFHYFGQRRRYCSALWLHIQLSARTLFWCTIFFALPGVVLSGALWLLRLYQQTNRPELGTLCAFGLLLALLLFALFGVLYCAYMNKYLLAAWLLAGQNLSARQAILQSCRASKGRLSQLFLFELSFVGWALLSAVFPPLFLFLIPYKMTATALYAQSISCPPANTAQAPVPTQEFFVDARRPPPTAGGAVQNPDRFRGVL